MYFYSSSHALSGVATSPEVLPRWRLRLRPRDGGSGYVWDSIQAWRLLFILLLLSLAGMRERLRPIQGQIKIQSKPGAGTTVEVFIPLFEPTAGGTAESRA